MAVQTRRLLVIGFALVSVAAAELGLAQSAAGDEPFLCPEKIAESVCLVDSDTFVPPEAPFPVQIDRLSASCQSTADRANFVSAVNGVARKLPAHLQKALCRLDHIFFDPNLVSTGMFLLDSSTLPDPSRVAIRINRKLVDLKVSLQTWATWKEQLSFAGANTDLASYVEDGSAVDQALQIRSNFPEDTAIGSLFFITAHELAHIVERSNRLISLNSCRRDDPLRSCQPGFGSYGGINWQFLGVPRAQHEFAARDRFCFYMCRAETRIPLSEVPDIYAALSESSLLTAYSGQDAEEDWADAVAIWSLGQLGYNYVVQAGKASYDLTAELAKRSEMNNYISKFMLEYPAAITR